LVGLGGTFAVNLDPALTAAGATVTRVRADAV
jgi:hypothetical protein